MLFKYIKATVQEVLDEYFTDPRIKSVCGGLWPYLGAVPSRLSYLTMSFATKVHTEGSYACMGSFQKLADAFLTAFTNHGGELVLGSKVEKIVTEGGRVTGVEIGGRRIRTSAVVSNADARQTFEELVGGDNLPAPFMKRLLKMRPSLSAFIVFASTTLDLNALDVGYETFLYKHWDHDETYRDILAGRPGGMWANAPTTIDPSLAPPGEHNLILTSMAAYDIGRPWEDERQRFTDLMLENFEEIFPGLRESLTFVETSTPETLQRYTLNAGGAAYGWENTPAQTGSRRSPHRPPVAGLYLAGHWTQPGTGSLRAIVSGLHAAHMLLLDTIGRGVPFWHADMPPA